MVVTYDKFGRTWNNRKIVWIKSMSCNREALYRWSLDNDGNRKLIYDKKNGMYDRNGSYIKETFIDTIPALEGQDEKGNPVENTWQKFPNTENALEFLNSITPNGFINQSNNLNELYDDDILIV